MITRPFQLVAVVCLAFACLGGPFAPAIANNVIEIEKGQMIHLRADGDREWSSFAPKPASSAIDRPFMAAANETPWTLSLRQQDVKQSWEVRINDQSIGRLVRDENDLRADFEIPPGTLVDGQNQLQVIPSANSAPDDIRVGEFQLHPISPSQLRKGATMEVVITDLNDQPIPGRITIVDAKGAMIPIGARSQAGIAVREGVLYTASGSATFGLQPGRYRLYAGRGFEYGMESAEVVLRPGDLAKRTFRLTRQVDTAGWVACDTHVHTVTHSGHGDCSTDERMVTIAGEGIELPIATDHNKQIDYRETSHAAGTSNFFTSVVGNEVTTRRGHFNVFPTRADAKLPNHEAEDWKTLFDSIFASPDVRVAILNHARDLHSNFRPFSPRHHVSLVGVNLDGFDRRFNAMELINSGAVQTDPMQLFGDWCGLINHGMLVTPVGSSDSHDVARYIVGQGRTYIACDDSDPANIPIGAAVDSFQKGRVVVSYGLFAQLVANESAGPGEMISLDPQQDLALTIEILGPTWTDADRVELWVNGRRRFVEPLPEKPGTTVEAEGESETQHAGVKARLQWTIPRSELSHDAWLSVVAMGPGVTSPHWPCAKPYQPDSIDFQPYVFTCTGPLWVDADGNGQYRSPADQAKLVLRDAGFDAGLNAGASEPNWAALAAGFAGLDPSVIHQAMAILRSQSLETEPLTKLVDQETRSAIREFDQVWRESIRAQLEQTE